MKSLLRLEQLIRENRSDDCAQIIKTYLQAFPAQYLGRNKLEIANNIKEILANHLAPADSLPFSVGEHIGRRQPDQTCPMIDKGIKAVKREIEDLEDEIYDLENEINDIREQYQDQESEDIDKINSLRDEIDDIDNEIYDAIEQGLSEDEIEDLKDRKESQEDEIDNLENIDYEELIEAEIKEYQDKIDETQETIEANQYIWETEAELLRSECEDNRQIGEENRSLFFENVNIVLFDGGYYSLELYPSDSHRLEYEEAKSPSFDFGDHDLEFDEALDNLEEINKWANQWTDGDISSLVKDRSDLLVTIEIIIDEIIYNAENLAA